MTEPCSRIAAYTGWGQEFMVRSRRPSPSSRSSGVRDATSAMAHTRASEGIWDPDDGVRVARPHRSPARSRNSGNAGFGSPLPGTRDPAGFFRSVPEVLGRALGSGGLRFRPAPAHGTVGRPARRADRDQGAP